ncbi:MAG: tRNA pseudouridine(38-40) synthase TruA [Bacilli bacterium]|nr:tRNA pseudouridine(38-40) synthase TruA [Bacilli bacterium]
MARIKCVVKYDGTNFSGFQIQNNMRTIQSELEKALSIINKKDISIVGSGRTDAKVHSRGQVIHFDTDIKMSVVQWKKAINSLLPSDVYISEVEQVDNDFHARFSAIQKEYRYLISTGEYDPLQNNYVYQLCRFLNIDKMQEAAKLFLGNHDFRNFCANDEEETESFVRNIKSINIVAKDKLLNISVIGDGFLRYMVRNIVGAIIEIGLERAANDAITSRLDKEERDIIPFRAPAHGLYLEEVTYESNFKKKLHNYHTHTYRCLHANGSDEEYVLSAIKNGYQTIGFSDHMMVPGVDNDNWTRGKFSEFPGYVDSIRSLKEKYKDQIDIYVGMECEYFPPLYDFLHDLLVSKKLDYLIYGNHYRYYDGKSITGYFGYCKTDEDVIEYTVMALEALKTGLFSCFAHPDLFMNSMKEWTAICDDCAWKLCETAKALDIPLEINQGGIRYSINGGVNIEERYLYPYYKFWEIAKKVGNKIVINVDAHNPKDFSNPAVKLSYEFAEKLGIKIDEKIEFKKVL